MLHEKRNESFHWKNRLDELEHLPNEPERDKTASWEKLHDRLRQKPVSRKVPRHWVAAACVLILAGVLWSLPKQRHTEVTEKNHPVTDQPINKSEIAEKEKYFSSSEERVIEKKSKPTSIVSPTNKDRIPVSTVSENTSAMDSVATNQSLPAITVHSNTMPDTANARAVTASPTKKLRVVHINELVRPVEEMPLAKVVLQGALPKKITGQDDLPVLSLSKNASDNLIKIKLSPSN